MACFVTFLLLITFLSVPCFASELLPVLKLLELFSIAGCVGDVAACLPPFKLALEDVAAVAIDGVDDLVLKRPRIVHDLLGVSSFSLLMDG